MLENTKTCQEIQNPTVHRELIEPSHSEMNTTDQAKMEEDMSEYTKASWRRTGQNNTEHDVHI